MSKLMQKVKSIHLPFLLALLFAWASASMAQEAAVWGRLDSEQIEAALTNATIDYDDGARQEFRASGRTYYAEEAGPLEVGQWRAQANRYCSQWSPSGPWVCYLLEREATDERRLRFVGERGEIYLGRLRARTQP